MSTTSIVEVPLGQRIAAGRRAQQAWSQRPVRERLRPARALRRLLVAECDQLCEALARDIGKSAEDAIGGDILPLADALQFLQRRAGWLLRPKRVSRWLLPL